MKWHQHPATWIIGSVGVLAYLCSRGKLPIPWLCMGVDGVKDPRNWSANLSTGTFLFGGGRDVIGKQLVYQQSAPFSYVNNFNPLEIKATSQSVSGPVGTIVDVITKDGNRYVLLNDTPIGDGIYSPITSNAQPV